MIKSFCNHKHNTRNQLYQVNEDFFENIDTEEKAYILGFWAADGWMNDRALYIAISVKDLSHLKKIKNTIPTEAPIIIKEKKAKFKRSKLAFLSLTRKKMRQDVAALGFLQQKGKYMIFPNIPKELYRHYIRGLWDGDGFVGAKQFSIVGQRISFFKTLQKIILDETNCLLTFRLMRKKFPVLCGGRHDINAINWLYRDNKIALDRKYQRFLKYWDKNSNSTYTKI